ncbi:unnamed protein product [Pedinophyceae sp. YPF-701]|nr:unnamed protein product [Pedinophyceae sp. YPF-701]
MPDRKLTFEAWVSTTDGCKSGTLLSYAVPSNEKDRLKRSADMNSFVVWDVTNLAVCPHFSYLNLVPDVNQQSCRAQYGDTATVHTASLVDQEGAWKHVAVTWDADRNGTTQIFVNGLRVAHAESGHTDSLPPGGSLVLGGEQDCYGGCTEEKQAFFGQLDEVRIWRTVRSQDEIWQNMRGGAGVAGQHDLVAYWKFNDPDNDGGIYVAHAAAADSSGRGNDLPLVRPPQLSNVAVALPNGGGTLARHARFDNSLALSGAAHDGVVPRGDVSVEFWAKIPGVENHEAVRTISTRDRLEARHAMLSYATTVRRDRHDPNAALDPDMSMFADDAILIVRKDTEYNATSDFAQARAVQTAGSVYVHINSNADGHGGRNKNWVAFETRWLDGAWHHVAVTWQKQTGMTKLYFDGEEKQAFWRSKDGATDVKPGVESSISAGTERDRTGSLALGQDQDCFGGCFAPRQALHGALGRVRIFGTVLSAEEVASALRTDTQDLPKAILTARALSYDMDPVDVRGTELLRDSGASAMHLTLTSPGPTWEYSTAPLDAEDGGGAAPMPVAGGAGHALALSGRQALMLPRFVGFPATALTLEFFIKSASRCSMGAVFSYATGDEYGKDDNSFLLFNHRDWGVSVMEDEGTFADHTAGIGANDGAWHHIAVTWESASGRVYLYDNGRLVWSVLRGKGRTIPSDGTLVVGREQDCRGGCFDSGPGAEGDTSSGAAEWGSQDLVGSVDQMRLWSRALSHQEILDNVALDEARTAGSNFSKPGVDPSSKGLVAYWRMDEGEGYVVRDVTGHGHDLRMASEPRWVVTRWFSICGDGVRQGSEECDTGLDATGGCDERCRVRSGWWCVGDHPSVCFKGAAGDDTDTDDDSDDEDGGAGHGHAGSRRFLLVAALVIVAGLAVFVAVAGGCGRAAVNGARDACSDLARWASRTARDMRRPRAYERGLDDLEADNAAPDFSQSVGQPLASRGGYAAIPHAGWGTPGTPQRDAWGRAGRDKREAPHSPEGRGLLHDDASTASEEQTPPHKGAKPEG